MVNYEEKWVKSWNVTSEQFIVVGQGCKVKNNESWLMNEGCSVKSRNQFGNPCCSFSGGADVPQKNNHKNTRQIEPTWQSREGGEGGGGNLVSWGGALVFVPTKMSIVLHSIEHQSVLWVLVLCFLPPLSLLWVLLLYPPQPLWVVLLSRSTFSHQLKKETLSLLC